MKKTQFALPEEMVRPAYDGGSIANIPATAAALFDVPFDGLPAMYAPLWQPIAGGVENVVVVLLDAMGWHLVNREREHFEPLLGMSAITGQLTSVFPSTTVNALSSVWTGVAPATHGLVGLRLFFPDQAVLGQMLSLGPSFHKVPNALVGSGVEPETFLQVTGMAQQLAAAGVDCYAIKGHSIVNSALSRMHGRGLRGNLGAVTPSDMFTQVADLLESNKGRRNFVNAYWPSVDSLSHVTGPWSRNTAAEVRSLLYQFETFLLKGMSAEVRKKTAVFLVADHGQIGAPIDQNVYVREHPALQEMLLMRSAGEPRVAYLYARQGRTQDVISYINAEMGDLALAVSAETVIQSGLLGPEAPSDMTRRRLGDVVVIMRDRALYLNPEEEDKALNLFLGRHGGLSEAEMRVPWLGFRLD